MDMNKHSCTLLHHHLLCPWPQVGIEDAIHTALLTLKEGFEGQVSGANIEVGVIGRDRKFRVLTEAEVQDYLQEVE